jgi:hypothetical protein
VSRAVVAELAREALVAPGIAAGTWVIAVGRSTPAMVAATSPIELDSFSRSPSTISRSLMRTPGVSVGLGHG